MITIHELAVFRGAKPDASGAFIASEYYNVGLDIMGGCVYCGASIAAYNAYPSKSGYWKCKGCIGEDGYDNVEIANMEIFGD